MCFCMGYLEAAENIIGKGIFNLGAHIYIYDKESIHAHWLRDLSRRMDFSPRAREKQTNKIVCSDNVDIPNIRGIFFYAGRAAESTCRLGCHVGCEWASRCVYVYIYARGELSTFIEEKKRSKNGRRCRLITYAFMLEARMLL